jgi:hypothetical protein
VTGEQKTDENWPEIVGRYESDDDCKPKLETAIRESIHFILEKKVLPSYESSVVALQVPAEVNNARIYNCRFPSYRYISLF